MKEQKKKKTNVLISVVASDKRTVGFERHTVRTPKNVPLTRIIRVSPFFQQAGALNSDSNNLDLLGIMF